MNEVVRTWPSRVMAGIFMILAGGFHLIQGVTALVNDDFFVVTEKWVVKFDLTGWGWWIHIVTGVIAAPAGIVFSPQQCGRGRAR